MYTLRSMLVGTLLSAMLAPGLAQADVDLARSKGAAWLLRNQRGDGSWATINGDLSAQATSAAILALNNAGLTKSPSFGVASAWLANADVDSIDSISRKIEGLSVAGMTATAQSEADRLFSMRTLNYSATWGGYGNDGVDFLDTALGLTALRLGDAGYGSKIPTSISKALCLLITERVDIAAGRQPWPTTWKTAYGTLGVGRPSVVATALVMNEISSLQQRAGLTGITCSSTSYTFATVLLEAQNWLLDQQNATDYGFGEQRTDGSMGASSVLVTAWVYRALNNQASPPQPKAGNALNWLLIPFLNHE